MDYFMSDSLSYFDFIKLPRCILSLPITAEAKILYCLLFDRTMLSQKNGWFEPDGRVYIFFKVEDAAAALHCGRKKAMSSFRELENAKLIERKRQGLNLPSKIYLADIWKSGGPKKGHPGITKKGLPEVPKRDYHISKTKKNNTELSIEGDPSKTDWMKEYL